MPTASRTTTPSHAASGGVGPTLPTNVHDDVAVLNLPVASNGTVSSPGSSTLDTASQHDTALPSPIGSQSVSFGSTDATRQAKPKQKRNKPTLSCLPCVDRKTKCDRGRPCLACVKRQSACKYTIVANLIASAGRSDGGKSRFSSRPTGKIHKSSASPALATSAIDAEIPPNDGDDGVAGEFRTHQKSRSLPGGSPFLFSNLPFSQSSPSNVFGVGSQHPFSNYWTCQGGLPEVITVLPSKEQADILIAKFFETVDPVYPFIHRRSFYSDYELFWARSPEERGNTDASLVALHYAMYALGTQFMSFPSYVERSQTAEFYCSAANQALRVYSYLNRTSMHAIQAMLLMAYFLMNDNHASDAYAWAGIHLRQSYAMRLHRDPELVVPHASIRERQQRRKLWQAVFLQDTFITVLLKVPPTATHSDVQVESLADESELNDDALDVCLATDSRVENLMSISVIAPQIREKMPPLEPHHTLDPDVMRSDIAYMRSMWHLGNLVQESLSSPCSLSMPLANSPKHQDSLVTAFRRLYKSFPAHLTTLDPRVLSQQAASHPRAVRQTLFLNSCFYHCLMLLHASENRDAGVESNIKGALEAAHEALWAFFHLWDLFDVEAGVWWEFQHRAFEESLLMANLLAISSASAQSDAVFVRAREDVARMLEIMERYGENMEMHATRKTALHEAFQRIAKPG